MAEDFEKVVEGLSDLPAMPVVAAKVLKMMQDASISAGDLAAAASHDPLLTARILKISNSSYYSLSRRVSTLEHAIVVLGEKAMRSLILAASLKGINQTFSLTEKLLWEDSIGCAIGAQLIARRTRSADPEEAFLGGLFRHLGKMVMNHWDRTKFSQVIEGVYNGEGTIEELERQLFPTSHAIVGAAVLKKWEFDDNLIAVVLNHEDFSLPQGTEETLYALAATVNLSENFCRYLGVGQRSPDESINLSLCPGARALQIPSDDLSEILMEFQEIFERDRDMFLS